MMYILFTVFTQGMYLPQCEFSGQKEGRKEGRKGGRRQWQYLFRISLADQGKKNRSRKLDGKDKIQRKRGNKRFFFKL